MKQLHDLVSGLRQLAGDLEAVAEMIGDGFSMSADDPPVPTITLEQVRSALSDKSLAGHNDKVRVLLKKHGAARLSEIDPERYPALLADAEAIQ